MRNSTSKNRKIFLTFFLGLVIVGTSLFFTLPVTTHAQENAPSPLDTAENIALDPIGSLLGASTDAVNAAASSVGTSVLNAFLGGINKFAAYFAYLGLWISAWILAMVGSLFDAIMQATVLNLKANLDTLSVIYTAWADVRSISNIIFIFITIYIGVRIVLGLDDGDVKRMIRNLIIVALLVNFSLFFTQLLIDGSNILTLSFYNLVLQGAAHTGSSFSSVFAQPLGLPTLFSWPVPSANGVNALSTLDFGTIIIAGLGGSFFLIVTAVVFAATAVLFLVRFVMLIFLMILSPLAFLFAALPSLQPQARKWRDLLIGQLAFGVIYMVLILFVALIVKSGGSGFQITNLVGAILTPAGSTAAASGGIAVGTAASNFANAPAAAASVCPTIIGCSSYIYQILFFFIIIALMIAALVFAIVFASYGTLAGKAFGKVSVAVLGNTGKATASLAGRAGRRVIGGTAASLLSDESRVGEKIRDLKQHKSATVRFLAGKAESGLQKTSEASFDIRNTKAVQNLNKRTGVSFGEAQGKGGYRKQLETEAKELVEQYKNSGGATRETTLRVRQARLNESLAKKEVADVSGSETYLTENEAQIRAGIGAIVLTRAAEESTRAEAEAEAARRGLSEAQKQSLINEKRNNLLEKEKKDRVQEEFNAWKQKDVRAQEIISRKNAAMANLRKAESARDAAEKARKKEREAKQNAFAVAMEKHAASRGGFNTLNIFGGKHAGSYEKAVEGIISRKKAGKDGEKVDKNKEDAEEFEAQLQSAIDASDEERIKEITGKISTPVMKKMSTRIMTNKMVLKHLDEIDIKTIRSTASTREEREKIKDATKPKSDATADTKTTS